MLEEVRLNLTSSARAEEDRAGQGARARAEGDGIGWEGWDGEEHICKAVSCS